MKKLIIYGLGDFAKLARHFFESFGSHTVTHFCADESFINQHDLDGVPVVAVEKLAANLNPEAEIFVAVGYKSMPARESMFKKAAALELPFASFIHPRAYVDASAQLGRNVMIFQGAQVEPFATVGDNCVMWTSSVACHDSAIGSHSFLAAQSLVGGRAKIGPRSFLGFKATVLHDLSLGSDCLVAANSLVMHSVESYSKCVGTPARTECLSTTCGVRVL